MFVPRSSNDRMPAVIALALYLGAALALLAAALSIPLESFVLMFMALSMIVLARGRARGG